MDAKEFLLFIKGALYVISSDLTFKVWPRGYLNFYLSNNV